MEFTERSEKIYQNYQSYLNENQEELSTPSGAVEMLTTDGSFNAYINQLTQDLPYYAQESVKKVCERQRDMLIEELEMGPSANLIGYSVSYFPILTDIYSDPVISQIANVYTTNQPILSIPKMQIMASVKNSDGSVTEYKIPRTTVNARGTRETITLNGTGNYNLFTLSASAGSLVTKENSRINKRYILMTKVIVNNGNKDLDPKRISARPDARGNINHEFEIYDDENDITVDCAIIGNVDWDSGNITYNCNFSETGYTLSESDVELSFSPTTGDVGRVKVKLVMENRDVNIDVKEDFEIELQTETIQDYRDIFNVNLVQNLSMAIKQQMMLNKDQDLAYFLNVFEPEMEKYGAYSKVDLSDFNYSGNHLVPANLLDIFKSVIPSISEVCRIIRANWRADPQYLLAGRKTASLLESLQEYSVHMPSVSYGESGFTSGDSISFKKMKILYTPALPEDKIYVIYKAPSDDLSKTAIVDFIYQPLYIIEETRRSHKHTYVKSRTALEFLSMESMGYIEIKNYEKYLPVDN